MAKKTAKKTIRSSTSKRSTKTSSPTGPKTPAALTRIDRKLVDLLNERAELAEEIGKKRLKTNSIPFSTAEVAAMLDTVADRNKGPLSDRAIRAIFREIQSGCRTLVKQLRIAHLGPQFSYSHLASIERFGQEVEFIPVSTIGAVFDEVDRGTADYGLVPLENSTDGRVSDTLERFVEMPLKICGEIALPIHHALLGTGLRSEITEVYSKPQALSQCRKWFARHVPSARLVEVASTAGAAELAKKKPGTAAVASVQAGTFYGLDILAEAIEDNPNNVTRFSVIGPNPALRTGNDKTAVLFQLDDRFGALAEALAVFKRHRVNLTWIESFPIPGTVRAYLFFVEMEGHQDDLRLRRACASLEKKTVQLRILGSFPVE
jgi:chorismate mutase / prephenate dehydratase